MRTDIPVLEGWLSLPAAAARLEVKRQRIFQMGTEEHKLRSLHQILGEKSRPAAYVVSEAEVCGLRREQLEAAIKAVSADHTEAGQADVAVLRRQLADVQADAVRLLYVQLGVSAEAAEAAGDTDLAKLLRRRAEGVRTPAAA